MLYFVFILWNQVWKWKPSLEGEAKSLPAQSYHREEEVLAVVYFVILTVEILYCSLYWIM